MLTKLVQYTLHGGHKYKIVEVIQGQVLARAVGAPGPPTRGPPENTPNKI